MTDEEILTNLFKVCKSAAENEVPLKVLLNNIKKKPRPWAIWQKNKVHLVTYFTMERKRILSKAA